MSDPITVDAYSLEQRVETTLWQMFTDLDLTSVTLAKAWDDWESLRGRVISTLVRSSDPEIVGAGFTGNKTVTVEVAMRSHKGDVTGAQHATLEAEAGALLMCSDLLSLLNARAVGCVFMAAVPRLLSRSVTGDWRITTQLVECYVAGEEIAAP